LCTAGRALAESEERFRLLVDSVTEYAIYMLDPQGLVVTWNRGAERSKGYKADEVIGQNFSIFFLPVDAEAGLPAQQMALAARDGRFETEAWRQRKDGSRFWALVTLTAIRGPAGELRGFAKVTRDMTERKRADEALRSLNAQLQRYRITVESVDEYYIYALDPQGRIASWELGAQKKSGAAPEEVLGRDFSMFFPHADVLAGVPGRLMEEAARTGRSFSDAWMFTPRGERVWSSGVLNAIRDENGNLTGFIRVARDMTKQKRMEEAMAQLAVDLEDRVVERTRQLESTVEALRRKNKEVEAFSQIVSRDLEEKEILLREIHHRVKNNLQVVQSLLRMRARALPKGDARAAIETIGDRVHAMAMVHERLYQSPDLAALALSDYFRDMFDGAIASHALLPDQVQFTVDAERIALSLDRAVPFGLLANELLSNCLKHAFPQGRRGTVAVSIHRISGAVRMVIEDDGVGLPPRFDPGACTSMGLKLAASLAHQLGGKLAFTSGPGCRVESNLTRI
jgi:PAS domain S-box-containing protein